jgi:hypothetical protein
MNYSLTLRGAIALLLAFLAKSLDLEIPYTTEEVTNAVLVIIGVGGFIATYIARFRQGDITWYGRRIR